MAKKYPFDFLWYTNWEIILKEKSCSVGGIGLGGMPNNEGSTDVGYFIDQKFRGLGIASEALEAIKSWAFQDPDLNKLRAETPLDNLSSQKVLEKNQFQQKGQKEILTPEPMQVICWECPKI
jgi:RimJ/RimL family protein N-acetyltransferase